MPMNQNKDRFKSSASPFRRHRLINDVRPAAIRNFPDVGMTLPTYRTSPNSPASTGSIAAPAISSGAYARTLPREADKKKRKIFTVKRIILVILLILLLSGGWIGGKFIYNALRVFRGNVFNALSVTKLKGEDTGRVNILLAGNSSDDPGHQGADLTDSIMIVSIDTKNNTAFLLSVPRDLWVDIPGYGHAKINEAYVDGQNGHFSGSGYPNGGMGLLEEVIQQDFGININYYALVNYNAFRDAVDAVGGIDVNIQSVDSRGLYDPSTDYVTHGSLVRLTNGMHHLDGEQALDLARARGDAYGSYGFPRADFDRTQNQRMMLLALKTKALSAGVLANPISLTNLFDSIGKNVQTDLSLGEARRLYDIGKNINNAAIQSASLNDANNVDLLANYAAANGESALIPAAGLDDFNQIQLYVKRLTTDNPVLREDAGVVVLNATATYGLASNTSKTLTDKGVNVTALGDARSLSTTTTIIDASGGKKPATLSLLKGLYGNQVTATNPYAGVYHADFILVVGDDHAQASSSAH